VLLVGHDPVLGEFAHFLVDRETLLPRHFPAPCLVVIHFSCGDWSKARAGRLEHFVDFSSSHADRPRR
jgi:phosphohistidine phosphatase SixA